MRRFLILLAVLAAVTPAAAQQPVFVYGNNAGVKQLVTINGSGQMSITCANCSGSGASAVDDAPFTVATDSGAPASFLFDDSSPDSVNEGDSGVGRMSANRNQYVTVRDAAGNERGLAIDANGAIAVTGGGGGAFTDDAAFTPATSSVSVAGYMFDDVAPDSVNEGDAGAGRMSANRNAYVTIRDAAGNERGLNIDANGAIAVSGGGGVLADGATFTINTTSATPVSGVYQETPDECVTGDNCVVGLTEFRALKTSLINLDGEQFELSEDVIEDTAHASGDSGPLVMAVRHDALVDGTSSPSLTGEYSNLVTDNVGALYTRATAYTTGGADLAPVASAASTNSTSVKNAPGTLYGVTLVNTTATVYYLRLYDDSSAPTCSQDDADDDYLVTVPIPASTTGAGVTTELTIGAAFDIGIGYCITGGATPTDNSNAAVGIYGFVLYK
jgi:hypothetical protein